MSTGGAAPTAATRLTNNMILLQDFYVTACPTNGLANVQASCAEQGPCCSKASVRFQFSEQREILLTALRGISFCSSGRGTIELISGRCTMRNHDLVSDGFLVVTAGSLMLLCSILLAF